MGGDLTLRLVDSSGKEVERLTERVILPGVREIPVENIQGYGEVITKLMSFIEAVREFGQTESYNNYTIILEVKKLD